MIRQIVFIISALKIYSYMSICYKIKLIIR